MPKQKRSNGSFKKYFTNQLKQPISGKLRKSDKDKIQNIKKINILNNYKYNNYLKSQYIIENDLDIIKTKKCANSYIERKFIKYKMGIC